MRVLVNALSARRGGILTYTRNLLTALRVRGVDITIVAPDELGFDSTENVEIININKLSPLFRFLWEQVAWRRIVQRHKPDILFSSANFGLLACPVKQVLLLREGGLFDPLYLANMTAPQGIGSAVNRFFRRKLMLMSAKAADHIITPTETMRKMVSLWQPLISQKCTVNPYGTINDAFSPSGNPRKWREDGVLRILYVSVYYPHKVPNLICQAVDKLNQLGIRSRATITMSLEEFKGVKGGTLDNAVVAEAHSRQVIELGHYSYSELPDLYRSHDVFVFPSVSETFGHPMAEAMSSGMPVIASNTGVNREICGSAALYFRSFMSSQIVKQILLLDTNPGLRQSLGEFGRQRATKLYSWNDHVDRLIDTFEDVLD